MNESDGINEIFDDFLRQALMVAARLGEVAARARQQHIERARAQSEQSGREAVARFEGERNAARVALAPVQQERWWASATPEQIGAAYQSATSWANEDSEIARTRQVMDEQLAKRGVIVTGSAAGQVTELVQAKQWAAENDPMLDGLHTREMVNSTDARDRERLNNHLVASWLASPDSPKHAQGEDSQKRELEEAREWAKETDPKAYGEWEQSHRYADTVEIERSKEADLIKRWKAATTAPVPGASADQAKAAGLAGESEKLRGAAYFKDAAAAGARADGDGAARWAGDLRDKQPLEDSVTPSDAQWHAQELALADARATDNWDTAGRREEFAQSLHGKADELAVSARMLADMSQGTHPSAAVKGPVPTATKARKNNQVPRAHSIAKTGR